MRGADRAGMLVKDAQEEDWLPKMKGALHILINDEMRRRSDRIKWSTDLGELTLYDKRKNS